MALLLPSLSFLSSSPSPPPSPSILIAATPFSGIQRRNLILQPGSLNGVRIPAPFAVRRKGSMIVRASADIDGKDVSKSDTTPSEGAEEAVPVENLPLESKLQLKLEQKLRMKLAKKIRLRRKRLVRKRQLRKKGRWPPSKMKKNKNV